MRWRREVLLGSGSSQSSSDIYNASHGSRGISFCLQIPEGLPWGKGKGLLPLCDPVGRTGTVGEWVEAPRRQTLVQYNDRCVVM